MHRNETFSERLGEALKRRGYWNAQRQTLEIGRFCVENGYLPSYVYRWLRGEVPRAERLLVLARQLRADPEWLVGLDQPRGAGPKRRAPAPIAGSSDASVPPGSVPARGSPAGPPGDIMFRFLGWLHQGWYALTTCPPTPLSA